MACTMFTPIIEHKTFLLRDTHLPRMDALAFLKEEDDFSADSWDNASNEEFDEVMEITESMMSPGSPTSTTTEEDSDKDSNEDKKEVDIMTPTSPPVTTNAIVKTKKTIVDETEETQTMKRERNRLAARRCRQKQKDRIDYLEKDVQEIETANLQVENEIGMLQHQLKELRDMLVNHNCVLEAPTLTHSKFLKYQGIL